MLIDIVFFSQFDVPEHVFNIGLMIGLLLMVQRTLPKSFHTRKILKKWPHLAPKGLVRKYTKNPCFLRSLKLLDVPIIFWYRFPWSVGYLWTRLNQLCSDTSNRSRKTISLRSKIWSEHPTISKIVNKCGHLGIFVFTPPPKTWLLGKSRDRIR